MLQVLVGYTKDLAIDIRWMVIDGDGEFFRITKRLHNRIHGQPGDGGALGAPELSHLGDVMSANAESVGDSVRLGAAGREYVRAHYVGDQHLLRYAKLFGTLLAAERLPAGTSIASSAG